MEQRFRDESSLIRVLIVARSVVMQAGLEALIVTHAGLEVVGSATSAKGLGERLEQLRPDVLLLDWEESEAEQIFSLISPDLASPDLGSRDLEATVLDFDFDSPAAVVLVEDWKPEAIAEMLRSGIQGILPGDASASEILGAIQAAAAGLITLHPDLVTTLTTPIIAPVLPLEPGQTLTLREAEVLQMLAEGLGNKAIARHLSISEHTVKFHIGSIFSKLKASSRTEAVILGARQGLILL